LIDARGARTQHRAMRWMYTLVLLAGVMTACDDGSPHFTDAATPPPIDAPDDAGIDAPVGHPGSGLVTGAVKAASPSYTLYGTLRSGDGSSASPGYVRRGGITGATQP
jgi:hypothetical protein